MDHRHFYSTAQRSWMDAWLESLRCEVCGPIMEIRITLVLALMANTAFIFTATAIIALLR